MKKVFVSLLFFTLCLFSGCRQKTSQSIVSEQPAITTTPVATTAPTHTPSPLPTMTPTNPPSPVPTATPAPIQVFLPEEVEVIPEIVFYDFDEINKNEIYHEIFGTQPGATYGTWYTVRKNGVEYYYALDEGTHIFTGCIDFYGYSIIDESHILTNGLSVGMTVKDILDLYPNMAIVNFNNNFIGEKVRGFYGWNDTAYPRSPIDFDPDYEYSDQTYRWTNQFDYIMVADIQRPTDTLPVHLGLLIKDDKIAAITFYYPTAG
ncbi:MAG: hypothetical protein J6J42_04515 [Lachnospiraceae bacterium]|nr:hypothetical protein [Lachnospiraceae bacterium]